ncbi:MAG: sensor domain-containing diguanylate cyclase [Desulfitobacteriaceae bacterium]
MPVQSYSMCIKQILTVFSSIHNSDIEWVLTDRERVLYTTAAAEQVLGITIGMHCKDHEFLKDVIEKETKIILNRNIWQNKTKYNNTVVGIPLKEESGEISGAIIYTANNHSLLKPEDILEVLQEMNREKDLEAALLILTRRSLKLFESTMAGIWLWRDEEFRSLAICAETEEQERFLAQSTLFIDFLMSKKDDLQENSNQKIILKDLNPTNFLSNTISDSSYTEWISDLLNYGIKQLLYVPLMHFGQLLGVLTLFSGSFNSFNPVSMHWLNQFMPLFSSFVYEQQLLLAAWDKEQALTLLLHGTEILVQAESEEQLLSEAGEMAMEILYLEAGFFLMQEGDSWQIRSPFGRLRHNETEWRKGILELINQDGPFGYVPHQTTTLRKFNENSLAHYFSWQKVLIEPLNTHYGVVGELWLMDSRQKLQKQRQEILDVFVRGLSVALETIWQRQELERLAKTDRLTGILNRQGFEQRIHEEMAGTLRRNSAFILLVLDLDGFKLLNDTQGHPIGDQALRFIAQNLRTSVREEDIVARTGGDEFTVVLTDLSIGQEAMFIMERLKAEIGLKKYGLDISIGVAEFPIEAREYEGLYRLADQRLYEGKNNGKGKIITGKDNV